jgi:hypothetical protein
VIRALLVVLLRLVELCLLVVYPLAPATCLGITLLIECVLEPPAPSRRDVDLRLIYPAVT